MQKILSKLRKNKSIADLVHDNINDIYSRKDSNLEEIEKSYKENIPWDNNVEKIEIVDGILLINECMHEYNDSFKFPLNLSNKVNQWILTNDQYFVIGDNILSSTDSRNYGLVKKSQISYKFICK